MRRPFWLIGLCLVSVARGETRDLVLVAGQSNAVGYDAYADELKSDAKDKDVLFWWRCGDPPPDDADTTSGGKWTHLQPQPVGKPKPKGSAPRQYGNFGKPVGGFGPEIGFARTLAEREGKPLAIVKAAFSGTGLRSDWNPADPGVGGSCYRALVGETKAAVAAAKEKGITLRLRALLWVQGESDANAADAPKYEEALAKMIETLRKDLDAPDLVALLAVNTHFGNDKNTFMPKIVEAQKAVAAKDKRALYVDTVSAETLLPTRTHFTAAGTLDVGRRFALALIEQEKGSRQ